MYNILIELRNKVTMFTRGIYFGVYLDNNNLPILISINKINTKMFSEQIATIILGLTNDSFYISDFYVDHLYRDSGYGTVLLTYAINYIKEKTEYKKINGQLYINDDVERLKEFYTKFGFDIYENYNRIERETFPFNIELNLQNCSKLKKISINKYNTKEEKVPLRFSNGQPIYIR